MKQIIPQTYAYTGLESRRVSAEEYLDRERQAEFRCEYFNGEIVDREGASVTHCQIMTNLIVSVGNGLQGREYDALTAQMRICNPDRTFFAYPDGLRSQWRLRPGAGSPHQRDSGHRNPIANDGNF